LIKYIIASVFAFERGEMPRFHSLSPDQAVAAYYDENLISHFGQNFNSPGSFSVIARRQAAAALVATGIMIAAAGVSGNLPTQIDHAVMSVSAAIIGPNKSTHVANVQNYVHSMKSVDWKKVQAERGEPARTSLTISLSAKHQVSDHRDQLNAK
jgi:hypothetical protein